MNPELAFCRSGSRNIHPLGSTRSGILLPECHRPRTAHREAGAIRFRHHRPSPTRFPFCNAAVCTDALAPGKGWISEVGRFHMPKSLTVVTRSSPRSMAQEEMGFFQCHISLNNSFRRSALPHRRNRRRPAAQKRHYNRNKLETDISNFSRSLRATSERLGLRRFGRSFRPSSRI